MKEKLRSYKDLVVWQKSLTLVKRVYVEAQKMTNALRRSLASRS
ncbi:MAG TPA: hypothetical protein P5186_08860 [Candidatus Paceibacterota bacterium]|nr:hypothetical protein [Verrucomicrobiota bacterium]HRY48143.1 hypothetical protein [Candidatus Paceibacterota bacterium]HSA02100.1 hypothetical protein [Candidatus Paceibacterota bacterium]